MEIKVERSKWSRKSSGNCLFDGEKYCILGFIGKASGLSDEEMLGKTRLPENPKFKWLDKVVQLAKRRGQLESLLININDENEPENYLTYLLQTVGHRLKFLK